MSPYLVERSEFVKRAGDGSFSTFAVIKNGEWYERAEMGWWGMTRGDMPEGDWNEKIQELLSDVDGETLISIYDCHI